MAPIPIYSKSPITAAAKPDGVTPKTASPPPPTRTTLQPYTPATTTASPTAGAGYPPPPQPGAIPSLPRPTSTGRTAVQNSTSAVASQPTPTQTTTGIEGGDNNGNPPPPQPGAVPVPPGAGLSRPPPPPPKQGGTTNTVGAAAATTTLPPQMAMTSLATSDPFAAYSVGRSTTTAQTTTPSGAAWSSRVVPQPTLLPTGAAAESSLEHPPGYVQDAYATDMNSSQRVGQQNSGLGNSNGSSSYRASRDYYDDDNNEESVWGATKKLVQAAGERLSAAESAIWERINTEK